jgi:hypothetical protein
MDYSSTFDNLPNDILVHIVSYYSFSYCSLVLRRVNWKFNMKIKFLLKERKQDVKKIIRYMSDEPNFQQSCHRIVQMECNSRYRLGSVRTMPNYQGLANEIVQLQHITSIEKYTNPGPSFQTSDETINPLLEEPGQYNQYIRIFMGNNKQYFQYTEKFNTFVNNFSLNIISYLYSDVEKSSKLLDLSPEIEPVLSEIPKSLNSLTSLTLNETLSSVLLLETIQNLPSLTYLGLLRCSWTGKLKLNPKIKKLNMDVDTSKSGGSINLPYCLKYLELILSSTERSIHSSFHNGLNIFSNCCQNFESL